MSIEWKNLGTFDIVTLLNQLESTSSFVFNQAVTTIDEEIVNGGEGSENFDIGSGLERILATDIQLLITPFLIDLLDKIREEHRADILLLLEKMASYTQFVCSDQIMIKKAQTIHDMIWGGLAKYLRILDASQGQTLVGVIGLLSKFDEYQTYIFPSILERIRGISEAITKARTIWIMHKHISDDGLNIEFNALLYSILDDANANVMIQTTASICLVDRLGSQATDKAIQLLGAITAKEDFDYDIPGIVEVKQILANLK